MIFQLPTLRTAATFFAAVFLMTACGQSAGTKSGTMKSEEPANKGEHLATDQVNPGMDTATFGAGCFWCVEAVFQRLKGVESIKSGYAGGFVKNPSYKEVCSGNTGHA